MTVVYGYDVSVVVLRSKLAHQSIASAAASCNHICCQHQRIHDLQCQNLGAGRKRTVGRRRATRADYRALASCVRHRV